MLSYIKSGVAVGEAAVAIELLRKAHGYLTTDQGRDSYFRKMGGVLRQPCAGTARHVRIAGRSGLPAVEGRPFVGTYYRRQSEGTRRRPSVIVG